MRKKYTYHTIESAHQEATKRGWKCHSTVYVNIHSPLKWECERGHHWETSLNHIISSKSECPYCSGSRGEEVCRQILQIILGFELPKRRPKWLINTNSNRLEYDGFSEDNMLAFEYCDKLHFEQCGKFNNLELNIENDKDKREVSRKSKVKVLDILAIPENGDLESFVEQVLTVVADAGLEIIHSDVNYILDKVDLWDTDNFKKLREIVESHINCGKPGKCLSKIYINVKTKVKMQCGCGKVWDVPPRQILNGGWCSECAQTKRRAAEGTKPLSREQAKANAARRKETRRLTKLGLPIIPLVRRPRRTASQILIDAQA